MTGGRKSAADGESAPNIVFILTDQQRADTIGAWGNAHMHTPNMDRLVREGMSFRQAYCPGATCTPSRAAIFTGMYPHNTGCYTFRDWGHHRTWVNDLNDAGYWCVNIGKMHFQPRDVSGGFHERTVVENPTGATTWGGNGDDAWGNYLTFHGAKRPLDRNRTDPDWDKRFQCAPWHMEEHLHSDVFVGNSAVSWIHGYARKDTPFSQKDAPFFLEIGFPGPHEPFDPPERFLDLYEEGCGPEPVALHEDLSRKPPQHQAHRDFFANSSGEGRIRMDRITEEDARRMRRHYYAKISLVDEQIGRVIAALEERGLMENTVIVLSSDHGELLGDHGLAYKWLMYDPVVHVPLVISTPETRGAAKENDDLVSLMDIGPTVLDLAGLPKPTRLEGQSLLPAVRGGKYPARRYVYCEDNYLIMCRSETHKLVYYIGQETGELYDLKADPNELHNLWNDSAHVEVRCRMKEHLLEWLASSCYHGYGYKSGLGGATGEYGVRWPKPGPKGAYLQGGAFEKPVVPHH